MPRRSQAELSEPSIPRALYLTEISESLSFKTAYPVTVAYEDGEHVARLIDLNLYGSGDTEYEAVAMLKREIASLYEELAITPDKELGKHPKEWKRFLLDHVSKR